MAYTITKTNGDTLVTIPDTERNTDYGISLVGRNYSGYGVYLNDNFVALMENFSKSTAPASPLEGQLWWNSSNNDLQIWTGAVWKKIGHVTASGSAPAAAGRVLGDLWWDSTNQQLKAWAGETTANSTAIYSSSQYVVSMVTTNAVRIGDILTTGNVLSANAVTVTQVLNTSNVRISTPATIYAGETVTFTRGSGWNLIGPSYTKDQQLTGIFPRTVLDTQGIERVLGLIYQKGSVVGAVSRENEYTIATAYAIDRLSVIKPGITLIEDAAPQLVRTVLANATGVSGNTVVSLTQTEGLAIGDYVITANIAYSAQRQITEIYGNGAIQFNATTSLTENEVIVFQRGIDQSNMFNGTATNSQRLNGTTADKFATLDTNQFFLANVTIDGNLAVGRSEAGVAQSRVSHNGANLSIVNTVANGNISISTVVSTVSGNPTEVFKVNGLNGLVEVRGLPTTANGVATKAYVDNSQGVALAALTSNVNALINGASVDKRDFGNVATILNSQANAMVLANSAIAARATIDSPTFTGVPAAPTASAGTNTTQVATTAFVSAAVTAANSAAFANAAVQHQALLLKADITSPDFNGEPLAPNPLVGSNSRQIATTSWVRTYVETEVGDATSGLGGKADRISPTLSGLALAPTAPNITYPATPGTTSSLNIRSTFANPTQIATVGFVANVIATMPSQDMSAFAPLASPALTGTPTAPTPAEGDNSTKIATTAFVATRSPVLSVNGETGVVVLSVGDVSGAAPLNNPTFTGAVTLSTVPLAGADDSTVPSTSWVKDITDTKAPLNAPTFIGLVSAPNPVDNSNTTTVATTAWVVARIASASVPKWGGAAKFVSTSVPSSGDGENGDIWFRYQA